MNHRASEVLAIALLLGGGQTYHRKQNDPYFSEGDKERMKQGYRDVLKRKGVKEWTIDGITVMARNEKTAIRKVKFLKSLEK